MSCLLDRRLKLAPLLERKSFFLIGPRSTGKSTLIAQQLPNAHVVDLLHAPTLRAFTQSPTLLEERVAAHTSQEVIAIDEIQKLPSLLDEVHRLMSKAPTTFLLTGSSARKLKRGAANLLAGRAWWAELHPLVFAEIPSFDLLTYLNTGGLPHIYGNPDAEEELSNYVSLYVREEVQAEALTRNLVAFNQFLDAIALANGEEINFESLASDCHVSPGTLKNYISILEDTLIGFSLPGFTRTTKRKAITRAKHYLFDIGVTNTLARRGQIQQRSELFGKAFEQFIICEVRAYISYVRLRQRLTYWRSTSQFEVDLIIGDQLAVEIKATNLVADKHLRGLRALKEEGLIAAYAVVSQDEERRNTADGITIYPWQEFLRELWAGRLL